MFTLWSLVAVSLVEVAVTKSLSAPAIDAIAHHRCNQVIATGPISDEPHPHHHDTLHCCVRHIRSNEALTKCQGLSASRALAITFLIHNDIYGEGNRRRIADFACCYTVYALGITEKVDDRCFSVCRDSYYTAGLSREQMMNSVQACKASNPGFTCFDDCMTSAAPLEYSADACLLQHSPELADGIPLGNVEDK